MYKKFVQDEVLDNGIIKGHMEYIRTNADRIRSMTDEELAKYLAKKQYEAKTTEAWSADVWLEILKEEAKT